MITFSGENSDTTKNPNFLYNACARALSFATLISIIVISFAFAVSISNCIITFAIPVPLYSGAIPKNVP